jgi:hypothetical protein
MVEDDRIPSGTERLSAADLWVAGGWFNRRWEFEDGLVYTGNSEQRDKAVILRAPKPGQGVDRAILDSYAGSYQIAPNVVVTVRRADTRLMANAGEEPPVELVPVSDSEFVIVEGPVKVIFEKDSTGKVTSFRAWQNGREMLAKRLVE